MYHYRQGGTIKNLSDSISLINGKPNKAAVVGCGPEMSYGSLIRSINCCAEFLTVTSGRVMLIGENSLLWLTAFYATLSRGLVAVPVDALSSTSDVRYILDDCSPAIVFCSAERRPTVDAALAGVANPPVVLVLEELDLSSAEQFKNSFDYHPGPDDTAVIIYTSGTTGSPKGVMLSFANLIANMDAVCETEVRVFRESDMVMMLLPIHHIFPLLGTLMIPLYIGATIAICPSMTGESIIRTFKDHHISIFIGVPRLYSMIRSGIRSQIDASPPIKALFNLAAKIKKPWFSRLLFGSVHRKFGGGVRVMVAGGAALDPEVARDFMTLGFDIVEGYGMTETSPMITFTRPGTMRPGSPGQALKGIEVEIRDEEIVVRGPNVMQGYYQRPEETAAILRDGWLHTGDLGEFDADGFLHITGRRKEIIVLSNGKNVNPAEIEARLEAMDAAVHEAAVYQDGDRLRLLLVPDRVVLAQRGVTDIDAWGRDSIIKRYNQEAAAYKVLAGFSLIDEELPRTRLGKLRRFQLAGLAGTGQAVANATQAETVPEPQLSEFRIISDYLEREKRVKVHAGDHLVLDVGLDSLDTIGLQTFLEGSFGFKISLTELASFETVGSLAEHVARSKTHFSLDGFDWAHLLAQTITRNFRRVWNITPMVKALANWFFRFYFRFSARGMRNIPNEPCIIAANHQSFFDAFFIVAVLKFRLLRNTFFFAKAGHIPGPLQKIAAHNNIIVMDLNRNLKESIMKVAEVLKSKRNMIIFPEGTRTKDGKLGDFKKMFAILSRELNVPIIPVSIKGAWEALPRGSRFPKPFKSIRIDFMPAIYPENRDYDSLSDVVRSAIALRLKTAKA